MEPYRLPESIQQGLQARARKTGRSLTEVTRQAVLDEIEAIEEYYHAVSLVRRRAHGRSRPGTSGLVAPDPFAHASLRG